MSRVYLRMGRVIVWSRKEMYLIAGMEASVKVAKPLIRKKREWQLEEEIRRRYAFTEAGRATP